MTSVKIAKTGMHVFQGDILAVYERLKNKLANLLETCIRKEVLDYFTGVKTLSYKPDLLTVQEVLSTGVLYSEQLENLVREDKTTFMSQSPRFRNNVWCHFLTYLVFSAVCSYRTSALWTLSSNSFRLGKAYL